MLHNKFTFWLENKSEDCFEVDADYLINHFLKWLPTKEQDWLEYYSAETVVRTFLSDKKGINSTHKESQFPSIMRHLKPVYKQFTYPHKLEA